MIYDIYITTKISFLCKRCYISFPLFLRTVFTLTFLDQATTVFNFQIYIKEGKLVCNRSYLKNYLTKRDLLNSVHFPILSFENQTLNPSRQRMDHKKYSGVCRDSVTDRYNDNGNYSRFLAPSSRRATLVGDYTAHEDIHGRSDEGKRERREAENEHPPLLLRYRLYLIFIRCKRATVVKARPS